MKHIKKTIFFFCLLLFVGNSYADMCAVGEEEFSTKRYNKLFSVEEAHDIVKRSTSFKNLLEEMQTLAEKYDVSDFFGIRLAHAHYNTLSPAERMVEKYEEIDGQKVLVTRPAQSESVKEAFPSSWILGKKEKKYKVFEYSTDEDAREKFNILKNIPQIFDEFYAITKKYDLQNVLAPAILTRQWKKENSNVESNKIYYIENSYSFPSFHSVVRFQPEFLKEAGGPITTAWSLYKNPKPSDGCYEQWYCTTKDDGTHNHQLCHHYT